MTRRHHRVLFFVLAITALPGCPGSGQKQLPPETQLVDSLISRDSVVQGEAFAKFEQGVGRDDRSAVLAEAWDIAGKSQNQESARIGILGYLLRNDTGLDPWTNELEARVTAGLDSELENLRVACFDTLNRIATDETRERLVLMLEDPSLDVRYHVIVAIGFWDNPKPYLERFLDRTKDNAELEETRELARHALQRLAERSGGNVQ